MIIDCVAPYQSVSPSVCSLTGVQIFLQRFCNGRAKPAAITLLPPSSICCCCFWRRFGPTSFTVRTVEMLMLISHLASQNLRRNLYSGEQDVPDFIYLPCFKSVWPCCWMLSCLPSFPALSKSLMAFYNASSVKKASQPPSGCQLPNLTPTPCFLFPSTIKQRTASQPAAAPTVSQSAYSQTAPMSAFVTACSSLPSPTAHDSRRAFRGDAVADW